MRRRVVAAMTGVAILSVLVFAIPMAFATEHSQQDTDRRELTQLAALAASRADATRLSTRALPKVSESEQRIGLYRLDARRVDGRGPQVLEPSISTVLQDRIVDRRVGGNLVTAVPVVNRGGVIGAVRTSEPLSSGRARVHAAWARLALLALLTDLVAALSALALAQRLTRPLADLVGDATRIGDGDFTAAPRSTGLPEVDQVGAALIATAGRLSDLVAREQSFSADASHQLRSPLAALRVTVESELTHPRPNPQDALLEAVKDIDRLERTIDEILALARETSPEREPVDVVKTMHEVARRWTVPLAEDRRRIVSEQSEEIPWVRVSEAATAHVLDVLVSNARDHGSGDVILAVRAHHGAVSLTVTDHGHGIRDPGALFLRRQAGARGNGIGLALARRLAEAEGGRLVLKQNGPVTVFELTMPVG